MKKIMILILALAPMFAVANFSLAAKNGKIQCQGQNVRLTINASRTVFSTLETGDDGHPQMYKIINRNSDGDSFVSYMGKNAENVSLIVTLADRDAFQPGLSDSLLYQEQQAIVLKCK